MFVELETATEELQIQSTVTVVSNTYGSPQEWMAMDRTLELGSNNNRSVSSALDASFNSERREDCEGAEPKESATGNNKYQQF